MTKRTIIRLTEGDIHNIIKESVKKILSEANQYETKNGKHQIWNDAMEEPNIGDIIIVLTGTSNVSEPNIAFIGKYIGDYIVETTNGKESINSWSKWMLRNDLINLTH